MTAPGQKPRRIVTTAVKAAVIVGVFRSLRPKRQTKPEPITEERALLLALTALARRQGESRFARLTWFLAGFLLLGAALLVGLEFINPAPRPTQQTPPFIAFESPVPELPGKGVEISVQEGFSGCETPLFVQVTVIPSAQFWDAERARFPRVAPFAIAISDPKITDVRFTDVQVEDAARLPAKGQLIHTSFARYAHSAVVRGEMKDWARDESGVSITFDANWTTRRSGPPLLGESCYATLPALTGQESTLFADVGAFHVPKKDGRLIASQSTVSHRGMLVATYGSNATLGRNTIYPAGFTDDADSEPAPSFDSEAGAGWQCRDSPWGFRAPTNLLTNKPSANKILHAIGPGLTRDSLSALAHSGSRSGGCSAEAVVDDSQYETVQTVIIAVIGLLLASGTALIFGRALFPRTS